MILIERNDRRSSRPSRFAILRGSPPRGKGCIIAGVSLTASFATGALYRGETPIKADFTIVAWRGARGFGFPRPHLRRYCGELILALEGSKWDGNELFERVMRCWIFLCHRGSSMLPRRLTS